MPHFELAQQLEPYREFIEKNAAMNTSRGLSLAGKQRIFSLTADKVSAMIDAGELDGERVARWCAEWRAGAAEERQRIKEIHERFGDVAAYRLLVEKSKYGPFIDPAAPPDAEDVAEMIHRAMTGSESST